MTSCIGRREFITLIGGAAAWPLAARAEGAVDIAMRPAAGSPSGKPTAVAAQRR